MTYGNVCTMSLVETRIAMWMQKATCRMTIKATNLKMRGTVLKVDIGVLHILYFKPNDTWNMTSGSMLS
jgi:hypothetical protein